MYFANVIGPLPYGAERVSAVMRDDVIVIIFDNPVAAAAYALGFDEALESVGKPACDLTVEQLVVVDECPL